MTKPNLPHFGVAAVASVFILLNCTAAVVATPFTTNLNIQQCSTSGCTAVKKRIALDSTSNHTSSSGQSLIDVVGAGLDVLKLTYGGADVGGPRVYLIEEDGVNQNHLFMLKNQEFTFDVELSSMPCGFNAALYFVGMAANKGGAENGTNYCDAQAVTGTFCSEMDVWEANTEAQQYTTHACVDTCGSFNADATQCKGTQGQPSSVCDQSGCGLNPFRYGPGTTFDKEFNNLNWYGPGSGNSLDSTQPFTVVTQFNSGGSATGILANISRFYVQNGKRVDLPTLYVNPPTDGQHKGGFVKPAITKAFCTNIYDRWDADGAPLAQMGHNMENGMVLAMSAWYDKETYVNGKPASGTQTGMSWLDGVNQCKSFNFGITYTCASLVNVTLLHAGAQGDTTRKQDLVMSRRRMLAFITPLFRTLESATLEPLHLSTRRHRHRHRARLRRLRRRHLLHRLLRLRRQPQPALGAIWRHARRCARPPTQQCMRHACSSVSLVVVAHLHLQPRPQPQPQLLPHRTAPEEACGHARICAQRLHQSYAMIALLRAMSDVAATPHLRHQGRLPRPLLFLRHHPPRLAPRHQGNAPPCTNNVVVRTGMAQCAAIPAVHACRTALTTPSAHLPLVTARAKVHNRLPRDSPVSCELQSTTQGGHVNTSVGALCMCTDIMHRYHVCCLYRSNYGSSTTLHKSCFRVSLLRFSSSNATAVAACCG
jgi:hypothetical protein